MLVISRLLDTRALKAFVTEEYALEHFGLSDLIKKRWHK